jgi:rhodanese-related sulfurtransferase
MGPFVPELITEQLNLVVALLLGVGFGFVLEQAGFSSSRRLAGLFYGYDFTVLRVFFTAAVTAMSGVLILGFAGLLDTDAIFVNPTWLLPTIVGGIIMGIGFILGGYCPGTSICAAAIGKIDAMFFVGGGLLGIFAFGESYPLWKSFNESTFLGPVTVFDSLGISQGWFAFALIAIAVTAFAVTTLIERRVNRSDAPSLGFPSHKHALAAAAVLALGVVFIFLPDRKTHLINKVSDRDYAATRSVGWMDSDELAYRIVDQEARIRIIDVRTPEAFARVSLPGSTNVTLHELFGREWVTPLSQRHLKKVVVGGTENEGQTAGLLLQELGYENIAVLRGGFDDFDRTILHPLTFVPTGSRWDTDVKQFREKARVEILQIIERNKNAAVKTVKKEKKVQGGC